MTDIVSFCSFSRLSDKAHSVAKESGNITLEPVASNNGIIELCSFMNVYMYLRK